MALPGDSTPPVNTSQIAKRRARNRVAQKSFRERQQLHIKQLETKAADRSRGEGVRIRELQEECNQLRQALLGARKRILGLTTAFAGVSNDIGATLGLHVLNETTSSLSDVAAGSESVTAQTVEEPSENQGHLPASDSPGIPTDLSSFDQVASSRTSEKTANHSVELTQAYLPETCTSGTLQQTRWLDGTTRTQYAGNVAAYMPCVWDPSSENQRFPANTINMRGSNGPGLVRSTAGPVLEGMASCLDPDEINTGLRAQFSDSVIASKHLYPPGKSNFPSNFSAHLAACEYFIVRNRAYKLRNKPGGSDALSKLISNMVNMFINMAWPDMRVWWAYLQSSPSVERILHWRLDPGVESLQELRPWHRPTTIQLCTAHPVVIDWVFFPSVRDRLIELYSYSPDIDRLICELCSCYVVETDITKLISGWEGQAPTRGYFHIWDLVQIISHEQDRPQNNSNAMPYEMSFWQDWNLEDDTGTGPTSPFHFDEIDDSETWMPMTLEEIFRSKRAALKLFRILHMDERQLVKLDPVFAVNHPELCDDHSILASGMDCTIPGTSRNVPLPKQLTRETIMHYKMMLWKVDLT